MSSLAKVIDDESLGRVKVPVRVILLKTAPSDFGSTVTRTNNFQNRIEERDFVAQDIEQSRLRKEMGMEGVEYQYLRSDDIFTTHLACELIELTTALACASGDPSMAVQVKTGISRFFQDLNKPPYKTLFNLSLSGARAFNSVIVQRYIDLHIGSMKRRSAKKSGTAWGILIHGNRIISAIVFKKYGAVKLTHSINDFKLSCKQADIVKLCDAAHATMVQSVDEHFSGNFLAVLFKNPTMSKCLWG